MNSIQRSKSQSDIIVKQKLQKSGKTHQVYTYRFQLKIFLNSTLSFDLPIRGGHEGETPEEEDI